MTDEAEPMSAEKVIGSLMRVSTPNGIDMTRTVTLGGIPQVLNIRGKDRKNPVLLFVHGGPGTPLTPTAWMWQRPIEEYFTVVHYDQRASGRSYRLTPHEEVRHAMGIAQFVQDAIELVEWLRAELAVAQVIIAGHSWGTVVATKAVLDRPELFTAYLGIGQIVDFSAAEEASYEWVCAEAHLRHEGVALRELEALAPYPGEGQLELSKVFTERGWVQKYGGYAAGRSDCDYYTHGERTSLEYQGENGASSTAGNLLSIETVLPQLMGVNFSEVTEFPVPIVQFLGRHDQMTPGEPVSRWMDKMTAPYKAVEWFEDSAHMAMYEEPGHFFISLLAHFPHRAGETFQGSGDR